MSYEELRKHFGHKLQVVRFGSNDKADIIGVECIDCGGPPIIHYRKEVAA